MRMPRHEYAYKVTELQIVISLLFITSKSTQQTWLSNCSAEFLEAKGTATLMSSRSRCVSCVVYTARTCDLNNSIK
jgi:hypothetical protein